MFDKVLLALNNSDKPVASFPALPPTTSGTSPGTPPVPPEGFVDQLLAFIYTSAHWLGGLIVQLLEQIIPLQGPEKLIDPIGYLALLTIFLIVAEVAKKITWLVVLVGWVLIVARVFMEAK
ncbi:MAG: hypothetical protein GY807_15725 [Gammaproteobacteria bacterium]|nr:hypothetical protein [Gammaproteobacteria bacterium]